ncbi:MAG: acyl-ACP thioesterase domain-containing protein [Spirochaetota bacterium]
MNPSPNVLQSVYNHHCSLRSSDADFSGRIKVSSLIQMFTDAGWAHVHKLRLGYEHLNRSRLTWVNTSLRLELSRHISWQQFGQITVRTWLAGRDGFYWIRDFLLLDGNNREFGRASTASILLDWETRKPYLKDDVVPVLEVAELPRVFSTPNAKLAKWGQGGPWVECRAFSVQLGELDINRHVSNACYAQWLLDSYALPFYQQHKVSRIQLQYLKEALYGEELVLLRHCENSDDFCLKAGSSELLRARIVWEQ